MFSDDKKSRARFVAIEKIEHLRRNRGIRSIVKGERQLARRIRAANSRAKELRARIGRSAGAQTCSRRGQEGGRSDHPRIHCVHSRTGQCVPTTWNATRFELPV